jgi:hypothetical protein
MVGWYLDVVVGYLLRIVIRGVRARGSCTWPVEKATVSIHDVPLSRMEDQSPRLAIRIPTKGTISLGFTECLSCCAGQRKTMSPDSQRVAMLSYGSNPESLRSHLCAMKISHRGYSTESEAWADPTLGTVALPVGFADKAVNPLLLLKSVWDSASTGVGDRSKRRVGCPSQLSKHQRSLQ